MAAPRRGKRGKLASVPGVQLAIENDIATLTVDRPEVRNALSLTAMTDFAQAVERAHAERSLRALIVTGAGGAFISGGDLTDLHRLSTEAEAEQMTDVMRAALDRLEALPCVTIAALEGPARGGGCEVALACDWRVAAADATLGFVQINVGVTTGWGGAARLQALIGYARALELLALGEVISAAEAQRMGLVNRVVPTGAALAEAHSLAEAVCKRDAAAIRAYKRILHAARQSAQSANAIERDEFPRLWIGEAHLRAVKSFLNKDEGQTQFQE